MEEGNELKVDPPGARATAHTALRGIAMPKKVSFQPGVAASAAERSEGSFPCRTASEFGLRLTNTVVVAIDYSVLFGFLRQRSGWKVDGEKSPFGRPSVNMQSTLGFF